MKVVALVICALAITAFAVEEAPLDQTSQPINTLSEGFAPFSDVDVVITNETIAQLALQSEGGLPMASAESGFSIDVSVGEITAWIQSGGNNPIETGIIRKVLTFLNSAGVQISGGSLMYQYNNGPQTELKGGCEDVVLNGGWNAHANLRPGFRISLSFGVNDWNLVVSSTVRSDCDFGMGGRIRARFGKKVFGNCIRLFSKTESVNIGADMVMSVISRLELRPTITMDAQLNVVIGLKPFYQIRGSLEKFEPRGKVSITIFGIHIGFIERAISNAIRDGIKKTLNQKTVDTQFATATAAVQAQLNRIFETVKMKIPLVPQQMANQLKSAVSNINVKQSSNM
jgi:hypothetical protein